MRKPRIAKRLGRWIVIYPYKDNDYSKFTELEHFRREQAYHWARKQNHQEFYNAYMPPVSFTLAPLTLKEPS